MMHSTTVKKGGSMKTRGESYFIGLPRFGAWLYDRFLFVEPIQARIEEIAHDLVSRTEGGKLLDVGTGPGRLLIELKRLNPDLELFGLDISASMIKVARNNLRYMRANLRVGSIRHTDYESNFFTAVTSVGSFYLWDYPEESLEEVFRILKKGKSAYLFEVYKDINETEYRNALRKNLRQLDWVRRLVGPFAVRKSLQMSYRTEDFVRLIEKTSFAGSYTIEKIKLSGIPMWARITLKKMPS
jgi:ubiquinone/menaquinone biosynthesis C-methylase UbiE